jgi:beta-ribofuranosylaminobenzene 5'-phosphate synthase
VSASRHVFVEAPARLHFGMLDLGGSLGRRFGGIGAAVPVPSVLVSARRAPTLTVQAGATLGLDEATSQQVGAAHDAARRVLSHYGVAASAAHVTVHRTIPAHRGLGSGTQIALATARAIAEIYELPRNAAELARATGRARRSAIGTYVFAHGGFIVEGGRRASHDQPAPLLAHIPIPSEWRCVVVIPAAPPGVSGDAETAAFATLALPPAGEAARVAHLALVALLPALVEGDFAGFGAALTEIQQINGRWFAAAQGGPFATGAPASLIASLVAAGATGVGQSSWGPAVYALAPDAATGAALAASMRDRPELRPQAAAQADALPGAVSEGPFSNTGARVWDEA